MVKWLHHLFNPHCLDCKEEAICDSCEVLKSELAAVRFEKQQLLKTLLEQINPRPSEPRQEVEFKVPINNGMSWNVRKHLLETEDRKKAAVLKEQKIEDLEKELGLEDAG